MPVPEIYLVVAEPALRSAIAEQLNHGIPVGAALREMDNLPAEFSEAAAAVVLDAILVDRKNLSTLRMLYADDKKPKTFLIGDIDNGLRESEDDHLINESFPKPLRLGHLLARLQLHLQPVRTHTGPVVFGSYRLEPSLRHIVIEPEGTIIRLTEKETHLLEYLGRSKQPISHEELLATIWGYDARIDTHTLETHIYRLRHKLNPDGKRPDAIIAFPGAYHLADLPK